LPSYIQGGNFELVRRSLNDTTGSAGERTKVIKCSYRLLSPTCWLQSWLDCGLLYESGQPLALRLRAGGFHRNGCYNNIDQIESCSDLVSVLANTAVVIMGGRRAKATNQDPHHHIHLYSGVMCWLHSLSCTFIARYGCITL